MPIVLHAIDYEIFINFFNKFIPPRIQTTFVFPNKNVIWELFELKKEGDTYNMVLRNKHHNLITKLGSFHMTEDLKNRLLSHRNNSVIRYTTLNTDSLVNTNSTEISHQPQDDKNIIDEELKKKDQKYNIITPYENITNIEKNINKGDIEKRGFTRYHEAKIAKLPYTLIINPDGPVYFSSGRHIAEKLAKAKAEFDAIPIAEQIAKMEAENAALDEQIAKAEARNRARAQVEASEILRNKIERRPDWALNVRHPSEIETEKSHSSAQGMDNLSETTWVKIPDALDESDIKL